MDALCVSARSRVVVVAIEFRIARMAMPRDSVGRRTRVDMCALVVGRRTRMVMVARVRQRPGVGVQPVRTGIRPRMIMISGIFRRAARVVV